MSTGDMLTFQHVFIYSGVRFVKALLLVISFSFSLCVCTEYVCRFSCLCLGIWEQDVNVEFRLHVCECSSRWLMWVLGPELSSPGRPGNTLSHCDRACVWGSNNTCLLALGGLFPEHLYKCPQIFCKYSMENLLILLIFSFFLNLKLIIFASSISGSVVRSLHIYNYHMILANIL